jgi:N-acetylglucosamine repressor
VEFAQRLFQARSYLNRHDLEGHSADIDVSGPARGTTRDFLALQDTMAGKAVKGLNRLRANANLNFRMAHTQIGNSELISQVNSRLVLQAVRTAQPTYRAAVARSTGLKPATVTAIVNDLIKKRMLQEVGGPVDRERFGRPPLMLEVNGDFKRILAVDLEPDRIRVAITNILLGNLVYQEERIDRFAAPGIILPALLKLCKSVLGDLPRRGILGAGVSLPGLIDAKRGVLISSTNMPQWHNVPVCDVLHKTFKIPVWSERSLHLAALYEDWTNPNSSYETTLVLSLRTGVGLGLIHGGHLYVGNMGFDGEIGHTVIDINGKPCECGSRGCLETFVSASAICERAREILTVGGGQGLRRQLDSGKELTPELIYGLAKNGDPDCAAIVREVGRYLGIATANMINLLAPHQVVICGSIDTADELLMDAVRAEVERRALPRTREKTELRLAREKDRLPLLGAAVLVARQLFTLPTLSHNTNELRHAARRLVRH